MTRKLFIAVTFFVIILGSLFFRDHISGLFNFGKKDMTIDNKLTVPIPSKEKMEILPQPPRAVVSPSFLIQPKSKTTEGIRKESALIPLYTGREVREVKPDSEEVKLFSEEQKRKLYAAIENFGQAVKENPNYLLGWIELGITKKVIGDYEGARDAWEYAGIIRPFNSVSFANLGEIYWRYLPDFPRSEKNFKTSIKNKQDDLSVYISLSDLYYYSYKEKKNLAYDVLLEGIVVNPEDANFPRALAALYERDSNFVKAIEWWKKVLEKEPGNKAVASAIEALQKKVSP